MPVGSLFDYDNASDSSSRVEAKETLSHRLSLSKQV